MWLNLFFLNFFLIFWFVIVETRIKLNGVNHVLFYNIQFNLLFLFPFRVMMVIKVLTTDQLLCFNIERIVLRTFILKKVWLMLNIMLWFFIVFFCFFFKVYENRCFYVMCNNLIWNSLVWCWFKFWSFNINS